MAVPGSSQSFRIVAGDIESGLVTSRIVIPTPMQPIWPPFHRVSEGLTGRRRRLPSHAHEREEVLTYVIEGFASYQLEGKPEEQLAQGSARLLTATSRAIHRISPLEGASIRWFNLVLGLPQSLVSPDRLQATDPAWRRTYVDNVEVRRLTGPSGPMRAVSGLECEVMAFSRRGTTFRRVGSGHRAVVYALAGQGAVDERAIETGETAFVEDLPGVSVGGAAGFQAVFASAPREPAVPTAAPAGPGG